MCAHFIYYSFIPLLLLFNYLFIYLFPLFHFISLLLSFISPLITTMLNLWDLAQLYKYKYTFIYTYHYKTIQSQSSFTQNLIEVYNFICFVRKHLKLEKMSIKSLCCFISMVNRIHVIDIKLLIGMNWSLMYLFFLGSKGDLSEGEPV
jgi:hypothetical protein